MDEDTTTYNPTSAYIGDQLEGTVVEGKLVRISGKRLIVVNKGKQVKTSAILPLVLFDLLAVGTAPYAYGGYGYGGYGPYGGGYGYPYGGGLFW